MAKFFNKKVWIVPGNDHMFRTEHDAKFYCAEHGIDFKTVERYDSTKEYYRWLELQQMERDGKITELKRQVEFELTPKQYRREKVREKQVKTYTVYNADNKWGFKTTRTFGTKKEATDFCRNCGIKAKEIESRTETVPVYKDVTILDRSVYTADFTYIEDGEFIVEDVKSDYTRKEADYVLRKKFLFFKYRILIRET